MVTKIVMSKSHRKVQIIDSHAIIITAQLQH